MFWLILLQPKDTKICLHFVDYQVFIFKFLKNLPQNFYLFLSRTHVILMKNGKETGRVVEYGKTGKWDKELAGILNQ
jgi:hypothetical protein